MELVFIHGPVASGKLTIAQIVAEQSGHALFHNHLIVDAVGAVFPFGSHEFVRLREQFWLDTIRAAAATGRSLVFTFAPEPTVAPDFPDRVAEIVAEAGGRLLLVALTVPAEEQERRLDNASRAAFGKLRSLDLLRQLRANFDRCQAMMPRADLTIDTGSTPAPEAAARILQAMQA